MTVRHATFLAIAKLSGYPHPHIATVMNTRACDWLGVWEQHAFDTRAAGALLSGVAGRMPTCPKCLVFMGMALEGR